MRAALSILPFALFAFPAEANLDVVFVLDTTGSMSGEIQEAKDRVRDIAAALRSSREGEAVRLGVVAYRDRGDAYVTKHTPLSVNVEQTQRFLDGLVADGGGDGPEDVLSGLNVALTEMKWGPTSTTDREVFLIADAPAHYDYKGHVTVEEVVARALTERVVINTIGCRSLGRSGVEQFRELAFLTEGAYHHIGSVDLGPGASRALEAALLATLNSNQGTRWTSVNAAAPEWAQRRGPETVLRAALDVDETSGACAIRLESPVAVRTSELRVESAPDRGLRITVLPEAGAGARWRVPLATCPAPNSPVHVRIGG